MFALGEYQIHTLVYLFTNILTNKNYAVQYNLPFASHLKTHKTCIGIITHIILISYAPSFRSNNLTYFYSTTTLSYRSLS